MRHVAIANVASDADGSGVERRRLGRALGTTGFAATQYRVAPTADLPAGLHAHADQEEVFVVLAGEATFETLPPVDDATSVDDGSGLAGATVTVQTGETVRFAPGEFQSARNDGDEELVVLALGAPRESADLRFPVGCPECAHGEMRLRTDGFEPRFVCPDCDASRVPTPCPECGGDDLRVRRGEATRSVVTCADCEATFGTPPVRGEW